MIAVEKDGIFLTKKTRAEIVTDRVTGTVAQNGGGTQEPGQYADVQSMIHRGNQACGDQQRIAGKEKTEEKAGFGKNNGKKAQITAPADQVFKIMEM